MRVYDVSIEQVKKWERRYVNTVSNRKDFGIGCYLLVTCDVWEECGEMCYDFGTMMICCTADRAQHYIDLWQDIDDSTQYYSTEYEIWHVMADDEYRYLYGSSMDKYGRYATHYFGTLSDLIDYVIMCLGDYEYSADGIALEIADYDTRCKMWRLRPRFDYFTPFYDSDAFWRVAAHNRIYVRDIPY